MTHVRDWYGSLIEQDWRTAVRYVEQKKTPAEQLLANPSLLLAPVDYYASGPVDTGDSFATSPAWYSRSPTVHRRSRTGLRGPGYEVTDRANFVSVEAWRAEKAR